MSKQGRTLPNPAVGATPDAAPPPDLSGGGDIMDAPPDARSSRPGPAPKPLRETFSNPGIAQAPDVKMLNERNYDSKRTKVRDLALEKMPDVPVNKRLPGSAPLETDEPAPEAVEAEAVTEEPALDEKTAAAIAAKDRENRDLRKKMRAIESSTASESKKLAKLKELAKTNPKGVADYLGIPFQEYLYAVQRGDDKPLELDEAPPKVEDDETQKLRDENARLRATESMRQVQGYTQRLVSESRDEAGKLLYPRIARVGEGAIRAVVEAATREAAKMRKLTKEEGDRVLNHFLAEKEREYKAAGASDETPTRGKDKPAPRNPTRTPQGSPMDKQDFKTARDPNDPRNRPSTKDIKERVRQRLIGS